MSIRYPNTSQTQDVKSQSTKRSVPKIAQPKRDSEFEQKTRIVSSREIWGNSQNRFFLVTTKEKSPAELKKTIWNILNVVLESFSFAQETKAVFISIRYPETSQTQEVKSENTKPNLRKLAQPKRDSAFDQKTRIVSSREIWGSSQTDFLVTTKATSPPELKKTFLERTQRRFGKFLFCSRKKSCFYKYSISQDISKAGCKEPRYQT